MNNAVRAIFILTLFLSSIIGGCGDTNNNQGPGVDVTVSSDTEVSDAQVGSDAQVSNDTQVVSDAQVSNDAQVVSDAQVSSDTQVVSDAQVSSDASDEADTTNTPEGDEGLAPGDVTSCKKICTDDHLECTSVCEASPLCLAQCAAAYTDCNDACDAAFSG